MVNKTFILHLHSNSTKNIMNKIYKILPFFIVEFLAKRFCEKVDNKYIAFNNVYFLDNE